MPLYGRGFLLDDPSKTDFKSPASLPIDEAPYTRLNGTWSYLEVSFINDDTASIEMALPILVTFAIDLREKSERV